LARIFSQLLPGSNMQREKTEQTEITEQTESFCSVLIPFVCSVIFVCSVFSLPLLISGELTRYEDTRISMACAYTIIVYGRDARALPRVVNEAFDEIDRIDRLMSHYKPDSPLSSINREAAQRPVKVDQELFDFIAECLRYSRESDGAFDITVGPLMKAWGFFRGEGRMPTAAHLSETRRSIGYRHVILNQETKTIRFDRPGVELDLGGGAKGYAVDLVVKLLKQRGIEKAFVSACGSTIYGLDSPPGASGWEVKIQDPLHRGKVATTVHLKNRALSISGSSEKFFEIDGVRYSHIMDPRTGRPVQGVLGVAVITDSGTAGDALDNVFFVQGVEKSREYLKRISMTEVFFFLPDAGGKWRVVHLN
jgi:thiamine biosynthesis lipoprotein